MNNSFPFYVLIATHGRTSLLLRTLKLLSACEIPKSFEKVVVVENGTKTIVKEDIESVKGMIDICLFQLPRANKSAALNFALKEIPPDAFVYFTDDDVRFSFGVLSAYADAASCYGRGHYFGGPMEAEYENAPPEWLLPYLPASVRGWDHREGKKKNFTGFNWGAFAEDIKQLGGFDERFGPGSESGATGQETNMQMRLRDNNILSVYVKDAKVWHYVPKERSNVKWIVRRKFRNGISKGLIAEPTTFVLGAPPYVFKEVVENSIKTVVFLILFNKKEMVLNMMDVCFYLGMLRGFWIRRR